MSKAETVPWRAERLPDLVEREKGFRVMAMASEMRGILPTAEFQRLLDTLSAKGYRIVGPTVRDGAVV